MATEELVTKQFQSLGVDIQKEVLTKCVSLCHKYDIDAETLVEVWMAYSVNNLNNAPPDLDNLDLLERKEFSKRLSNRSNVLSKEPVRSGTSANLTIYSTSTVPPSQSDDVMLSNYMTGTPKRVKVESEPTSNELCPASYSPNINNSVKYTSRANAGSVVHSYGDEQLLQNMVKPNGPNDILNLNIEQVPNDDGDLYTKAVLGFELLHEKASIFDGYIQYISQNIMKKLGLTETSSVRHKTQMEVVVAGRIECDADARLHPKSVVLQGTWAESLSQTVNVDLDNLKQYSIFPGQVVVMRGVNPRGDRFVAHEVFHEASLPIADHKADMMNCLKGTISIVVAAGPYTTSDNMNYEPFKDLITYISTHRPHVVIMTGPFMDCEHSKIKDNTMAETYKSFFDKLVDSLSELNSTSPYTKIYVVSSQKDAFHVNIYPTPPYSSRRKYANVQLLPDPCTLDVNGVLLGITGTDVLMHISQEEISMGAGGDRLSRLVSHVLGQQSYYPLWPPPLALAVDAALWAAHAHMTRTPHILVLPSNFRYFVKEVNGCVVMNPEHLTKGTGGGTFGRMLVTDDDGHLKIAAQIVRI